MKPLQKGRDYYITEDGLYVFTEYYLLARGKCCGNNCRHCPYTPGNSSAQNRDKDEGGTQV